MVRNGKNPKNPDNLQQKKVDGNKVDKTRTETTKNRPQIVVPTIETNMEWLKRTLIGFTANTVNIDTVARDLEENDVQYENLISWGNHKFILTLYFNGGLEEVLAKAAVIWGDHVKEVRKWKKQNNVLTSEENGISA